MRVEVLLFSFFAVVSVASALGVVALRNPIRGAISLIVSFFSLACLFLLENAELVAVLQVLVYAGAIMVLFVFVIMLVENKEEPVLAPALGMRLALPFKVLAVALVALSIVMLIVKFPTGVSEVLPDDFGSVRAVGREFFGGFLFQFELTGLLLLVGIVGAVIVSKRGR